MTGDGRAARQTGFWGRLRRLFGADGQEDPAQPPAPEEAATGGRSAMIQRVIAFSDKRVEDVMVPRADIVAVDSQTPLDELLDMFRRDGHSRMPVYREHLDDPLGMIHIKDVVGLLAGDRDAGEEGGPVIPGLKREILFAPPSMAVTDLLLKMQTTRIHLALVIDEFGGTDGLVTIEDLVEQIVGEIHDEHDDEDEPHLSRLDGGALDADARVEVNRLEAELNVPLTEELAEEVDTLGGLVVSLAGRVPQRGEVIVHPKGFDFLITEADARRLRRLTITDGRPALSLEDTGDEAQ